MGLDRFHQLYELGQEIANTAFWSASVGKEGVKAVYQNPGTGMSSSPILIHNRQEWEYWQEKLGQYKAPQQRIKELEQQLAQAQGKIARQEEEIRTLAAQRQDKAALLTAADKYIKDLLPLVGENDAMRALLERVSKGHPNWFTLEISFDPEEEDMNQLVKDISAFLAEHPK